MTIQIGRGVIVDHGMTHDLSKIRAKVQVPYTLGTGADRFEGDLIQDILISEKIGESPVNLKRRIRKQAEARTKKYFDGTDSDDYLFADVFETVDRRIAVSAPAVNKSVTDE